jgi:hypothetical protein
MPLRTKFSSSSPAQLGFRMPAEWEYQAIIRPFLRDRRIDACENLTDRSIDWHE